MGLLRALGDATRGGRTEGNYFIDRGEDQGAALMAPPVRTIQALRKVAPLECALDGCPRQAIVRLRDIDLGQDQWHLPFSTFRQEEPEAPVQFSCLEARAKTVRGCFLQRQERTCQRHPDMHTDLEGNWQDCDGPELARSYGRGNLGNQSDPGLLPPRGHRGLAAQHAEQNLNDCALLFWCEGLDELR